MKLKPKTIRDDIAKLERRARWLQKRIAKGIANSWDEGEYGALNRMLSLHKALLARLEKNYAQSN